MPETGKLMDKADIEKSLKRITLQFLEEGHDLSSTGIIGIQTRGVPLAQIIQKNIEDFENTRPPLGILDTAFYRDDYRYSVPGHTVKETDIPFNIKNKTIILVDDVLHTGRTIRAALDAIMDMGRPHCIKLAVLADRGEREIPIRADFTGKTYTTAENQEITLFIEEIDRTETSLWLTEKEEK
ncbi:MAG: bifunctional pyr operon transcriptional regulator/uracil phosphoribosyltransferase PyrR [Fibrobacterota bacterium]